VTQIVPTWKILAIKHAAYIPMVVDRKCNRYPYHAVIRDRTDRFLYLYTKYFFVEVCKYYYTFLWWRMTVIGERYLGESRVKAGV